MNIVTSGIKKAVKQFGSMLRLWKKPSALDTFMAVDECFPESEMLAPSPVAMEPNEPIQSTRIGDFVIRHLNEKLANDNAVDDLHIFERLTQAEMDDVFPVLVIEHGMPGGMLLSSSTANWALHSFHYQRAIDWFLYQVEESPGTDDDDQQYKFAENLYASLTLEQRVILQRGYEISMLGKHGPRIDDTLYHIELMFKLDCESDADFPMMRKPVSEAI